MGLFRRGLTALLLSLLGLGAVSIVRAAEPIRTVRVGAYDNPPKIYKDVYDKPSGVFADVLRYIAEKENWNLEYVWGTWDVGLTRLEKGEIDIMTDVAISEDRIKRFDFTNETVLNSWAVIYVQKGSTINSILDLKDKKISILKSSVYEGGREGIRSYLKAFGISATIEEVQSYRAALDLLELGKVDAAVVSRISGLVNQGNYSKIEATKIFLEPSELRFALTKGDSDNPYLVDRLDYWVKKLKDGQDNFLNESLERHGLQELESEAGTQVSRQKELVPLWAVKVIMVLVAIVPWLMIVIVLRQTGTKVTDLFRGKV